MIFRKNMLQVRKAAICLILIRQQKVSSSRNSSRTAFFRFAIKRYPFLNKKWLKFPPKIWLFCPKQAYPKSVPSVHTQKMVDLFFWKQNCDSRYSDFKKQIWFWSKCPKNELTVPVYEKKINHSWGQMSVNLNWFHIESVQD